MYALYELQKDLHKQIKNSYSNFKKKGAAKMSRITAQTRLNGLERWYAQFEANHAKILCFSEDQSDHEYFKSHLSDQVTDDYFDRKGEFAQFIEDTKQLETERNPPVQSSPTPPILQRPAIDQHSLPKINLPKFTGLQSQWENFARSKPASTLVP